MVDEKVRVLYIEDDEKYVERVAKRIKADGRLEYLGHALGKASGTTMARELQPDVVLMDLSLTNSDFYGDEGIAAARIIRLATDAKIVFLTAHESPDIMKRACKAAFASGYIFKSQHKTYAEEIYNAATAETTPQKEFIKQLVLNDLSPAEQAVLDGLVTGRIQGNTDTSSCKGASVKTIANQKTKILKKLELRNERELLHVFWNW